MDIKIRVGNIVYPPFFMHTGTPLLDFTQVSGEIAHGKNAQKNRDICL